MAEEMQAEPVVEFEGKKSDWTEHAPMLANANANQIADELAIEQAESLGFTEAELKLLQGSSLIPPRDE